MTEDQTSNDTAAFTPLTGREEDTMDQWRLSGVDLRSLYVMKSEYGDSYGRVIDSITDTTNTSRSWYKSMFSSSRMVFDEPSNLQVNLKRSIQAQQWNKAPPRQTKYRISPSLTIDYTQIMRWVQICESSHNICRERMEQNDIMKMLVVDCFDMKITTVWTNEKYLALSYVWGGTEALQLSRANMSDLCIPGNLEGRHQELSQTVCDAIHFVKGIGQRYLWVDRLCIIQDEEAVKHNGIKHMDVVYKNAWAVIIAGAGADTNEGLPGIHGRQRPDTYSRTYDEDEVSDDSIAHSVYESRAWTYQERLLARRRFVFLNDFLLFQCLKSTFRDDVYDGKSQKPYDVRCMYLHEAGMAMEHFPDPYMAFQHIIHSYTPRHLTFESDILKALTGISHALGEQMFTRLVYGLPENNLTESLCWYRRYSPEDVSGRRLGFPSWSWCGWRSAANVPPLQAKVARTALARSFDAYPVISGEDRLQLQTILFRMKLHEQCEGACGSTPTINYHSICDNSKISRQCGRVQIDAEPWPPEESQIDEDSAEAYFVILQDAVTPAIPYKQREVDAALAYNRCRDQDLPILSFRERELYDSRPFLILLLVLKNEREDGTTEWERAGIGHIYRRAILLCQHFSFEDELILC